MADHATKPARGGADRVRRVNAHRAAPPVVLSPSGQDRTAAVVAWARRLLDRQRHSGGGSAP